MSRWQRGTLPLGQALLFALLALLFWWLTEEQNRWLRPPPPPPPAIDMTANVTETFLFNEAGLPTRALVAQTLAHYRDAGEVELTAITYREQREEAEITAYAGAGYWSLENERLLLTDTVRLQKRDPNAPPLVLATEALLLWPEVSEGASPMPTWLYQGARWGRSDQLRAEKHFTHLMLIGNASIHWPPAAPKDTATRNPLSADHSPFSRKAHR